MDAIHHKKQKPSLKVLESLDTTLDLTAKEYARITRKIDWHILPLISILYLFSFLDRVNVGYAKIAGMSTDLNLTGLRYNIISALFFIPYCLGQIPSNILLKLFRPSRWLPAITVCFGLVTTLMYLVKTYHGLIIARLFVGVTEAGLFPGLVFYISLWYPRAVRAKRNAMLFASVEMGGALAGLLAYGIEKMEGIGGLHGWQWIFCLEGLITVVVASATFFLMPDHPETASFLTEAERRYVIDLLKKDSQGLATHYDFRFVLQAFKDYKLYLQLALYIGLVIPDYGAALFLPTIINDLGYTAATAQLLSVPPYIAGAIFTILVGICSDRFRIRGPFIIFCASIAMIGFIVLYTQTSPGIAYFGTVLVAMGLFPCIPVDLAWFGANAGGDVKRNVAFAMVNGFGNLGGICAAFIFFDPPRFHVGLNVIMGCLTMTILLTLVAMWDCNRLNKEKERTCSEREITDDDKEEFNELGDDSPLYRYAL